MKLRILGCSGGIGGRHLRTTSMLLDNDILIDAGTGVADLSLTELSLIDHIFLTHSHLDHVASIPFMVDTVGGMRDQPLTLWAVPATLEIVRNHIFNWSIWPDFSQIPSPDRPYLRYREIQVGDTVELKKRKVSVLPANHVVPAVGYHLDSGKGSLVFTGDTTTNDPLWAVVNKISNLKYLSIETGDLVHDRPKRVVRRGVAGKYQAALSRVQVIPDRRHHVVGRKHADLALLQLDRIADLDLAVAKIGPVRARNLREIRPDAPVEDVVAHDLQGRGYGPQRQRLVAHAPDRVHHEGNARDVIEMRVREKNVIDEGEFGQRKIRDARPGIHENVVVEQHRRGAKMPPTDSAAATQNSELHRRAPVSTFRRTRSRHPTRAAVDCGACLRPPSNTGRRARIPDSCDGD